MSETAELPRWTRVAAYALCTDSAGRVLLVRIAPAYPAAGRWTLPGGGLKFGEDPEAAVLRELTEETGLIGIVESIALIDSRTRAAEPARGIGAWHAIRIVYRVEITGGELRDERDESSDAAAWFTRAEVADLPVVDLVEVALRTRKPDAE
jgi:ADP-ribose pyrophosphatase YjhB (NUDIX family)